MRSFTAVARCALAALMVVMMLRQAEAGVTIVLGDLTGWTNKANIDYTKWLSSYRMKIGDTLKLDNNDYTDHTAMLVDKEAYDTCGESGQKASPFTITPGFAYMLTWIQSGDAYVICGIPGHCVQGQKVYIQVLNADGSVNTTTPTAPTPPTLTTPGTPRTSSGLRAAPPIAGFSWTSHLVILLVSTFSLMAAAASM